MKSFVQKHKDKSAETDERLFAIEQRLTCGGGSPFGGESSKDLGRIVAESEQFKSLLSGGGRSSGQINVGSFHKTAIVNATGQNQPLVPDHRVPGIQGPLVRRLTIRDLLPQLPTQSNLVQFTRELLFTNNAAPVTGGSPNSNENATKAESALTFELANAPVKTLAHWIPASRQILDDAPALAAYINARLTYGLKLAEENELLNGSGSGDHLTGLVTSATAYDTARTTVASDSFIDVLSHAITRLSSTFAEPDGIVLNPADLERIVLTKESGIGISSGQYIYANPQAATQPRLWGLPVVATYAMAESQFLVGAFQQAAAIWDRSDSTVEVSREHSDYFVKNMVAILAEERLALTVFRPTALVYGGFPFGS